MSDGWKALLAIIGFFFLIIYWGVMLRYLWSLI